MNYYEFLDCGVVVTDRVMTLDGVVVVESVVISGRVEDEFRSFMVNVDHAKSDMNGIIGTDDEGVMVFVHHTEVRGLVSEGFE